MKGLDPDLRALQEVRDQVARAKVAVKAVSHYRQADADRLCAAMAEAGARAAHDLARLAVQETGMGRVHYKTLKNLLGTEGVWDSIRDEKTVGVLSSDPRTGITEVAAPVGIVAGVIPSTNPTSSALFKSIIAVKGRNAVVLSPHPSARRCIGETAEIMRRAIERAGGPPDLVTCLQNPTLESTGALMKHKDVAVILATGGAGLVRAAYSSGKPAYGVGPGNVPAYIDRSADARFVAEAIVTSQSFDNGTLCCSEQALVIDQPIYERLMGALQGRGAHLCSPAEIAQLEAFCNTNGHMNPKVVGQDPWRVAEMAGFHVRRSTTLLLAPQKGVGPEHKLSIEILCPLLSVHVVDGWREGCQVSTAILHQGGLGHTLSVHSQDAEVLDAFFLEKPASRIIVNGPSSPGATGFSTHLMPSMSLGCGPQAGNITSDNITAKHLIHIKRAAAPRADWKSIERRFHDRVAVMTGDPAPRGSGLPGDPGLASGQGSFQNDSSAGQSAAYGSAKPAGLTAGHTAGNAAPDPRVQTIEDIFVPGMPAAMPSAGPSMPAVKVTPMPQAFAQPVQNPAPTFARPVAGNPRPNVRANPAGTRPAPANPQSQQMPQRAATLTPAEIEGILEHAGAGCPLGPCQGCPHLDQNTGACCA